jgi:LmbE family N-acetylglucosaminyl deacetylase
LNQHRTVAGKSDNSRRSRGDETQTKTKLESPRVHPPQFCYGGRVVSYKDFVGQFARLYRAGKALPLGRASPRKPPRLKPDAPIALVFSPHPDDECIVGGLALRLKREAGFRVINVAVTLGGEVARRGARRRELSRACEVLGFEVDRTAPPRGFGKINLQVRAAESRRWAMAVNAAAALLLHHQPRVIFFPHEYDWHPAHIGTHWLVMDALATLPAGFECRLVETEYWAPMASPNLLVESSVADVADLVAALAMHAGEVRRNPYHLRLPAWLMDNVRRGAELVGGAGGNAPDFTFATLYRLRRWKNRDTKRVLRCGRVVSCRAALASVFLW